MLKLSKLLLILYVNRTYVSTVNLPSAGGNWNVLQEYESTLSLTEGINTISFRYDTGNTGNVNLDRLAVNLGGTADPILLDNGGFERTKYNSAWTEWHPEGQTCAYGVDSGSGTNPPESPMEGDKRAYFYSSGVYQQSIHQGISIPNGTYQVRAWVRVANTAPSIGRMGVTGYGGNNIYVDMPDSGSGWVLLTANNVSVTTGYLDIGFYCASPSGTTVHIDGVQIVQQ